jgi:hypothetical protein
MSAVVGACAVDDSGLDGIGSALGDGSTPDSDEQPTNPVPASPLPAVVTAPTPVPTGNSCDPTACAGRRCEGGTCSRYAHCNELHQQRPNLASGVYEIDPDGASAGAPFRAYCDMTSSGGGWTLVMKLDGALDTFRYTSPLWTNDDTLNSGSPELDRTEAKLASFSTLAFTQLRVGMAEASHAQSTLQFAETDLTGTSLMSLFQKSTSTPLDLVRSEWTGLLPNVSLQQNCSLSALNLGQSNSSPNAIRVRIGFLGNNEPNCSTPDSWMGFGSNLGGDCQGTTVGGHACYGNFASLPSPVLVRAFGYVFVR